MRSDFELNKVYCEHALEYFSHVPDRSIHTIVTSPPYYGLRDYNHPLQIGMEETPELFIENLVTVFRAAHRCLRDDGTLWVNMGDSYWAVKGSSGNLKARKTADQRGYKQPKGTPALKLLPTNGKHSVIKPKDLIGIPWMLAFALRADGWYLRQDIIWSKPNPMPESVTDRCTKSHEYIFMFSKSKKYYYDAQAIKTPLKDTSLSRLNQDIDQQKGSERVPGKTNGPMKAVKFGGNKSEGYGSTTYSGKEWNPKYGGGGNGFKGHSGNFDQHGNLIGGGFANKKSVWEVTTKPFSEAHFATFPEDLILPCILAGSPVGGIVCDPFMGAYTTAVVCCKTDRHYTGSEINPSFCDIGEKRIWPYKSQFKLFTP